MRINESTGLLVGNPIIEEGQNLKEAAIADLDTGSVRAIYPVIRAIHSEKLTLNYTFYPERSLTGKQNLEESTGFSSFVLPFGKPLIREHRLNDSTGFWGDGTEADVPMGRIIYTQYKRRGKNVDCGTPKDGYPGTRLGKGWIEMVAAVTDPIAIERILGNIYHTVSIGADADSVIESISGVDLAKAYREDLEIPEYRRGQMYDGKLSYWNIGPIKGKELSFVNNPADRLARVEQKDLGDSGIRLLLAEKKTGTNEFKFYDAKTLELVESVDEGVWDPTFSLVDSIEPNKGKSLFIFGNTQVKESVSSPEETLNKILDEVIQK
jgi:hypothetical protein